MREITTTCSSARRHLAACGGALALTLAFGTPAGADIANIVIFGDSLSDTGNILNRTRALGGIEDRPEAPFYSNGRWTNGSDNTGIPDPNDPTRRIPNPALNLSRVSSAMGVWHERLATRLTVPAATDSLGGGRNYAYGGAVTRQNQFTDFGPTQQIGSQVRNLYRPQRLADTERTLFVMWGGGNDIRDAAIANGATRESVLAAADTAVANMEANIRFLKEMIHPNQSVFVLWPNLPPLGTIPDAQRLPAAIRTAMTDASARFTTLQATAVMNLRNAFPRGSGGLDLAVLDIERLFGDLVAGNLDFRPTNTTQPIIEALDSDGGSNFSGLTFRPRPNPAHMAPVDPDAFVFWDQVHPTARVHQSIGDAALRVVPAPGAASVLVMGLLAMRRRRLSAA
ncbi:MAG: SGNH/GDSL hydrolase family protein [Phycisphaerales bacterium]